VIKDILNEADSKMDKSVEATREEFAAIRAGRATPAMFSKIVVNYYGTPTPLQQLASFTAPEARIIMIQPYDMSAMNDVERAIRDSDLGVNPANDGRVLRCVFPELTEEQGLEKLEKDGEVGKDDVTGAEKRLDVVTKKHTDAIDEMLKNKEAELLEV
jgi:ribosome recycling factor